MASRPAARQAKTEPAQAANASVNPAPSSAPSPALLAALARTIDRAQSEGVACTQEYVQTALAQHSVAELTAALQALLNRHQVRLVRTGAGELAYAPLSSDTSLALQALSAEEALVYRLIEAAQREGIWAKTLKARANINRTFPKVMKHLEGKKLVKCFKSITSKYKKIYILHDLEPADHHKGGVWYDARLDFDHSFVRVLKEITLAYVREQGGATIAEMRTHIAARGVSQVALGDDEVRTLANALRHDGLLECVGVGPAALYKPAYAVDRSLAVARTLGAAALTPCLRCPVFHLCGETAAITPLTCVYLTPALDW